MTRDRKYGLAAALLLIWSIPAIGADRTIQFAGVASNFGDRNLPNLSPFIACTVIVANTGVPTQQVRSITFNVFDSGNATRLTPLSAGSGASTLTQEDIYQSGLSTPAGPACTTRGTAPSPTCTGVDIPGGGIYVATVRTLQLNLSSFTVVPCFGTLTVQDKDPSQPGSVVASGAISFVGEQAITGGQFQGAMYLSGSHYMAANLATNAVFSGSGGSEALPAGTYSRFQMNAYCKNACEQEIGISPVNSDYCLAACGGEQAGTASGGESEMPLGAGEHRYRNMFGWLEESDSSKKAVNSTLAGVVTEPFHDASAAGAVQYGNQRDMFRAAFRTANPHFAGGYVVEMIMGPFDSICSANPGYWANGGDDFDHSDSPFWTDSDAKIARRTAGAGPPERLYCSHGHNNDSPFGYTAQSSPFTIWGGNAF